MKQNMGSFDKAIRVLVAAAIAGLYFTHQISGLTATIGIALVLVFLMTSIIGVCPLYLPFGISTRKK
jgi:hypothetical protein